MSAGLSQWVDAALEACGEVGEVALATRGLTEIARRGGSIPGLRGAFVALVGDEHSVEIGVSSSVEGCIGLTRRLLCFDASAPDPGEADIADALGEIANMVAGGVKASMASAAPGLRLGLPMFVHGHVSGNQRHELVSVEVLLGDLPLVLTVVRDP